MKDIFEKFLGSEITIKFPNRHQFKFKVFMVSDNYFGLKLPENGEGYYPYNSVLGVYVRDENVTVELKR